MIPFILYLLISFLINYSIIVTLNQKLINFYSILNIFLFIVFFGISNYAKLEEINSINYVYSLLIVTILFINSIFFELLKKFINIFQNLKNNNLN